MDKEKVLDCINCGKCTKECSFLNKHELNLSDFSRREDLAYNCFLCGKCAEVCPKDIHGKRIAMKMRRKLVEKKGGVMPEKGYEILLAEKNPYKFSNYRNGNRKSVIFAGCNFPSFFPKTTKHLVKLLGQEEIGVIYECCGKPVEELGLFKDVEISINNINKKLKAMGVEELIMVCPNCYHFLQGKLDVKIISIYEKLDSLNLGKKIEIEKIPMYYPCPDRKNKEIMADIRKFLLGEEIDGFPKTQCCGCGGCASKNEGHLSVEMARSVADTQHDILFTYCASCISNYKRKGFTEAYHMLPLILGIEEQVPLKIKPFINRAICKFK